MLWNVLERTWKLTDTVNTSTFFSNFPNFVQLGVLHFLFTTQAYAQDAKWKKLLFIEMEIRSRLQASAFRIYYFFLQSSFSSLKKIKNILCILSLPRFAVHNRKLSQEMCFILPVYYTGLCTGALRKKQLLGSFVEPLNGKSRKKISYDCPVWCY